jgi:hypothetical protein
MGGLELGWMWCWDVRNVLFFSKKMENENEEEEFLRTNIIKHTA